MKLGKGLGVSLAKEISGCRFVFYWILLKKASLNDGKNMANENSALRWGCDIQMSQARNKKRHCYEETECDTPLKYVRTS